MIPSDSGREYLAGPDDVGRRLDKVLRVLLKDKALSEIYAALRKGRILVNGRKADPETRIEEGDRLFLNSSILGARNETPPHSGQDNLAEIADILLLATEHLIFVNKPRGELSQGPGGGRNEDQAGSRGPERGLALFRPRPPP